MTVETMSFCGHRWYCLTLVKLKNDWDYRETLALIRESYQFQDCLTPYKDAMGISKVLFKDINDAVMFKLLSDWQFTTI